MNITVTFPKKNILVENNGGGGTGGTGDGDMLQSVYDPTGVEGDAFDMDNMAEGETNKLVSDSEKSSWDAKAAGDHNHSGVYEPADAGIQSHISSAHAPSDAKDNIYEATNYGAFPETGSADILYVAKDTNLIYRWGDREYVLTGLVLGEKSTEAYRGDRGKTAYDHSQVAHAPSNAQANADITKAEIEAKLTGAIISHSHANGFSIQVISGTVSPADGTTYYVGWMNYYPLTTTTYGRISVPKNCTLKAAIIDLSAVSAAGTNEEINAYVRVNDTTDTLIATLGAATAVRRFSNLNMNVALTTSDYLLVKFVFPSWATNPTNLIFSGILYFE